MLTQSPLTARTIFILDDNADFRASAQWWLSGAGYEVIDFDDPATALQSLPGHAIPAQACMLLDVRMPGMSGLEFHDRLKAQGVGIPVIYMTGHGDVSLAVQAMQKGAVTFLEKPFADDALELALEHAFRQSASTPPDPAALQTVAHDGDPAARAWAERFAKLSPREREVLDWVLQDKLNKTIADLIGISIKTVELHRSNLMKKLGARSATHLIKMVVSERVV